MATKSILNGKPDVRKSTAPPLRAPVSDAHPLGEIKPQEQAAPGFDAQDLLETSSEGVPPWQRDSGQSLSACQLASVERQDIVKALTKLSRFGVILDESGHIVQGNLGWSQHLAHIPTLSAQAGYLVPLSMQSQNELGAALKTLFDDYNRLSVPVALRDLDGWVIDVIHLRRVGNANPKRAYVILPKSHVDLTHALANLGLTLQLTPLESTLVRLIVTGQSDREMAAALSLKQSDIKRGMRELTAKFRVRQKSDIVRIVASFP